MEKKYDKLIRDKIPEVIDNAGKKCELTVSAGEELNKYFYKKIEEELNELVQAKDSRERLEELADLIEVIDGFIESNSIDKKLLYKIKDIKKEKRGGFSNLILKKVISNDTK